MSKRAALKEAAYARELIRQLLAATDPDKREEIANELTASVCTIAAELNTPNYNN